MKNFFDQPINNMIKTYKNIRKITIGQGDDYTTGCLLDYTYFKKYYKMIAVDLNKQKLQMLILKQFSKLILLQIQIEMVIQDFISFLKQQKKLFLNFHKELQKFYEYNFIELNFIECKVYFNFYQCKMTQCNRLNVKLSNSQLNKFKSAIKHETEVVLRL